MYAMKNNVEIICKGKWEQEFLSSQLKDLDTTKQFMEVFYTIFTSALLREIF